MPRFSVVTPVHNPPADALAAMLASVQAQTHGDWEHCIVDDGSTEPWVRTTLAAVDDPRVKVAYRSEAGGIVAATNDALAMASGEFVALLDHDDLLHPEALARIDAAITDDVDYLYSDEDKVDAEGRHYDLFLKPDWSPERMQAQMYTCHLSVLRRSVVEQVGGFRDGFDGSQDWDLVLRVSEVARRIVHVRETLYHWRSVPSSAAADPDAKPYAAIAAHRAVNEHLERIGVQGRALPEQVGGVFRIRPHLAEHPFVSIVIPTAGGIRPIHGVPEIMVVHCVQSVVERSTYPDYEIVVVADTSMSDTARAQLAAVGGGRVRIVDYPLPFNFSDKVNRGALHARGDLLVLLNDDTEVLADDATGRSSWIESMAMYALQPAIGAVGARLYFGDRRLQHTGVVFHGGLPSHPYRGFPGDHGGYFSNARTATNYTAVTAACMMVRREVFETVGGFSLAFPVNYNDVDFCCKLHTRGYRNVYTPEAELLHFESATREPVVHPDEILNMRARWQPLMSDDPFFHPQFFQENPDFNPRPMLSDGSLV